MVKSNLKNTISECWKCQMKISYKSNKKNNNLKWWNTINELPVYKKYHV